MHAAALGIRQIYQPGYQLIKAGVMLLDLVDETCEQWELDLDIEEHKDRARLMEALDVLNGRYGKGTVHMASSGVDDARRSWGMRQERRTPQYTTRWEDVPVVRA